MTRLKYIGAAIVILCFGLTSAAQNISNKGKEFWVAYGHHQYMETDNSQDMTIYLSTEADAATVTVTIDSSSAVPNIISTWWRRTYIIPPYTVISVADATANSYTASAGPTGAIPKTGAQDARLLTPPPPSGSGGEGHFRKRGIHIESDVPIVAYAHIYASVSSGATMLLPVESWGYSYTTINSEQVDAGGPAFSWVTVIAKENNTKVMITPSVVTRPGKPAGIPFEVTLMKGQVYQIIGQSDNSGTGNQFTGTTVKSIIGPDGNCKPIAVFAGSSRTRGESDPCGSGSGRDNDMQQCYPEHAWGKRYLTAPFGTGSGTTANPNVFQTSVYKIVVRDPTTVVKRNGVAIPQSALIVPGNYYKFNSNEGQLIEADKPIMVGQFMSGSSTCNPGGQGDPEMVFVSPLEQAIKNVVFYRNHRTSIGVNLLTLVIPTAGLASLVITDHTGNPGVSSTIPHPRLAGYSIHTRGWPANASNSGQTRVRSDSAFNIIAYGLGGAESYAFSGGAFINNLNYLNGLHNIPDTTAGGTALNQFTGVNTPTKIGILLRYIPTKLTFKFSAWPATPPPGIVTPLSDGIAPDVTAGVDFVMDPVTSYFVDSPVINGIKYYRYMLPDSFRFNIAGTHNLPVIAESPGIDNCGNKENMLLTFIVVPQPTANFTLTHATKCTKDSITVNGPASAVSGSTTYNLNQWYWTVSQGATVIRRDSVKTPSFILPPGTYSITMNAVTVHGLVVTPVAQSFTVYPVPTVTFMATPDTLCLGQNVTFSQTSSYQGPATINYYSWNLDDGAPGTSATWTNKNKLYPTFGTYNTYLVVGVSPTCLSDTSYKVVVVNGQAHTTITPPSGCLTGGVGQFQASGTAQGGTTITSYSWNFGDPSTGGNNTSILQNPAHTFSAPGVYQVILNITTATGCMGADTIMVNANIKPELAWSASSNFNPVCQTAAPFSLAFGTVTNNINGTPKYTGPGIDSAGLFNPQTAGPGTHTIVYTFASDSGCVESIDTTITVSPRPAKPIVVTPVNYCQGDASPAPLDATALTGHTLTWYSDPALTATLPGTPTPSTATAGTFKYYVTQKKDGCESEADTITVNITPSVANNTISADQSICQGSPTATLVTTGTVSGGTGTYSYQWQSSPDGTTWTDIPSASAETYNAGNLNVTTKFRRTISSGLCGNTSNVITISVTPALGNNTISASHDVCEGKLSNPLTGSTPSGGDGSLAYQWLSSPNAAGPWTATGVTSKDYPAVSLTATTYFRRVVTSGVCTDTSALPALAITIIPNADGNIAAQDADICVNEDGKIIFTATAGTAPYTITYTITGPSGTPGPPVTQNLVTSGTQFIVVPQGSAAGTYSIAFNSITNSNGCVKSTGLNTVTINVTALPVISINPVAPICAGTSATLTANGATTYVWNPGAISGNGISVSPASTQTYVVTGTTNGCEGSASVTVTVNPRPGKPTVTSPVTYCQGDQGVTALVANGDAGNTITWYNNPGLTGGSTTAPVPSTATAGTTTWYVTQTNSGNCEGEAETISVTITPSIATNDITPATQNICAGFTPTLTALTPTGGTGSYTYQWQSSPDGTNWTDISGATNLSYSAPALTVTTHFRRIVNSGLCSNTSATATVNVTAAIANNTIGVSHNVCEGKLSDPLTGSTPTGGDGSFGYIWLSSPNAGGPWTSTGVTTKDYAPVALAATTHFLRVVTSGVCTDTTDLPAVTITVIPNANGNIAAQDADICQYDAGNVIFTATAGTGPFTIDYTVTGPVGTPNTSNVSVNSGAVLNVVPTGSAAGTYTITLNSITNSNGCVRAGGFPPVTILVTETPVVSIAPVSAVCVGGTVTLTASGATTYAWTANTAGGTLNSTTGASVTTSPAAAGTYNFSVVGTTNGCNSNPANINVVINPKPNVPSVTSPVEYCQLGAADPLTGTGDAGNTITWYDNAGLTNGVTTAPKPKVDNAGSFQYYVTQTNSFGCESTPAIITINVTPGLGGNDIGNEQTICQGNTPATIISVGTLTGGNGTYNYQWQASSDGVNFTDIPAPDGTMSNYSPGTLNDTIWYRRKVTSGLCGSMSDTVRINVFEGLSNYEINGTYPVQICENTAPATPIDGQTPTGSGTITFTWEQSTDGGLTWAAATGTANQEDYQPPVLTTTTKYRRKVTNGPCTAYSGDVEITVMPVANGNITAPAAICEYEAAAITFHSTVGTGTFIIQYNITAPGGTVTSSGPVNVTDGTSLNVIPAGSTAGVYKVTLTSLQGSNGCVRTAGLNSVDITVNPRPSVTIDPVTAICEGESKTITAHNATSYVWNPGALNGNSINVTPAVTTIYQVIGTSLGCESNPVSVVLTVNPKPTASFTIADNEVCLYETASFTNSSVIDSGSISALYWDFDNSNLDTTGYTTSPLSQSYSTHRVYNVNLKAVSDKGCISNQFIAPLTVNSVPVASFDPPAFVCMPNGIATFQNTSTNANGSPMNYIWTFGDPGSGAGNTSNNTNGSHSYPDSASYDIKLLAISAQGCRDSVTTPFNTFFNKPVAKFGVTPDTLCQGIQNAFFDSSFAPGSSIDSRLWTFGDGSTSTEASPTKTYLLPGNYQVNLKVINTQGCTADVNKNIVVYLQPVVNAGPSFVVPQGTAVTFNAQTNSGALSLAWTSPTNGVLNDPTILKPTYLANQDGVFVLTATGDGNCSATDTMTVKVLRPITIPNAFSPNGDGINDTWGITNLGDYPHAVVEVYNRHGQSVYKQYGYGKPWDGKLNGKDLPIGTYYYIIDPKSGFQRVTGYVVIVR